MTSARGTAMTIATSVERKVPASAARAPYWWSVGAQATVVRTLVPRVVIAGQELTTRTMARPNMAAAERQPAGGGDSPEEGVAE